MNIKVYRIVGISILLTIFLSSFTFSQNQPKAWYVYKYATGLNNGTSWTNAWTSFAAVNWNLMQNGDILYISGGLDSIRYNEGLIVGKANITISRSIEPGHNGIVIFDGVDSITNGIVITGLQNVTIDGKDSSKFIVRNFTNNGIRIRGNSDNTKLLNLKVIGKNQGANIFIQYDGLNMGMNNILLNKVRVIQPYEHLIGQMDGVQIDGVDSAFISECYFQVRGQLIEQHTDIIQAFRCKDLYFDRCEMYHFPILQAGTSNKQGLYLEDVRGDIQVSNCYIYMYTLSTGSLLSVENWNGITDKNIRIFNNTLVTYPVGSPANIIRVSNETGLTAPGSAIIKNNIFVGSGNIWYDDRYFITSNACDYNIYYKYGEPIQIWVQSTASNGSLRSWDYWRNTLGFDSHSYTSNPLLTGYIPDISSIAFNNGANQTNLGYVLDIKGTVRPQDNYWDIGAYEIINAQVYDSTAPYIIQAELIDSITLNLIFSETLEQSGAENPSNYQIDNGIQINSALLLGNTVRLQTSIHSPGFYSVVVNNVTDTAGNVISAQNNTANYGYNPDPLPGILKFTPTGTNASSIPEPDHLPEKTFDGLGYNSGDPTSRWAGNNLPQWIGYDLGNSIMLSKTRIQFYKWNEGRIYNYSIMVSTDSINWTTVKQNILSSNTEWTEENFEPIPARYVRIVVHSNNQNNWASLWETEFYGQLMVSNDDGIKEIPNDFVLEQNYPNPFNPSTKIRYSIPASSLNPFSKGEGTLVSLKVFDILGNEVATLVDEYKEPGRYEVEFDASELASGVYIYRLQADGYLNTRKMILLR